MNTDEPAAGAGPAAVAAIAGVAGLALTVLIFALAYRNTMAFGPGPDPFDYITTARHLLEEGTLRFPVDEPARLGLDSRYAPFFIPEPFVPAPGGEHYVSLYPAGTSLLMALLSVLAGSQTGPFLLAPILAAGCIILIYLAARRWFSPGQALAAAAVLALSPVFLGPARAPLSDIPSLFFVLLALLFLGRSGSRSAALSGLALGLAVLTRVNAIMLVPAALIHLSLSGGGRRRRLLAFICAALPVAALHTGLNAFLYGAPWRTGYSLLPSFFYPFSLHCVERSLPRWLQGLFMALGPLTILAASDHLWRRHRHRLAAWAWLAGHLGFLSFYCVSGNHRLHRLLLPCLPLLILLAMAAAASPARRRWRHAAMALLLAGAVSNFIYQAPLYDLRRPYSDDSRLPGLDLSRAVALLEPDAVVFSRVYGGRLEVEHGIVAANWSRAGAIGARSLLTDLLDAGHPVYLLDTDSFASRGRWWLGGNSTPIDLATPGAVLERLGPPLPGISVPLRRAVPPGQDDEGIFPE